MFVCLLESPKRGHNSPAAVWSAFLFIPLGIFLIVHLLLRLLAPSSLNGDDADLLYFNQALAWGYSEQPPLYSWLYYGLSLLVGEGVFSLTLLRMLLLGGTGCFLFLSARELFGDRQRTVLAGFSLFAVPQLAWHAVTYLTHSLLLCCVCAATFWVCARLGKYGRWRDYLLLGICAGLGMLSKYNYVLFLVCLGGAAATLRPLCARLLDWRMLCAAVVAAGIALPHGIWLWDHAAQLKAIYHGKLEMYQGVWLWSLLPAGAVDLLKDAVLLAAPTLGLFALFFPSTLRPIRDCTAAPARRWLRRFLLVVLLVHFGAICLARAGRWHERWLEPFFLFLPLYLFAGLTPERPLQQSRRGMSQDFTTRAWQQRGYIAALVLIALTLTLARGAQIWLGGSNRGYNPIDSDYRQLAQRLRHEMHSGAVIIAEDAGLAGNLRMLLPGVSCVSVQNPLYRPAAESWRGPCMVIWDAEAIKEMPPWMRDYVQPSRGNACLLAPLHRAELPPVSPGRQQRTLHYVVLE